jgi:anti-sigma factor ChrR (cupin superfamily)
MNDPFVIADLMDTWQGLPFVHFREGVEVHYIKQGAPALAVLRYAPGAKVPLHLHTGLETIVVLDGVQSDERGDYGKGTLILNPAGTTHSVWSEQGCAVLIQWERPIQFPE